MRLPWGFSDYQGLQSRLADLPRTPVPGQVTVQVSTPQTVTIYYENPNAAGTFVVQSSGTNTLVDSPVDLIVAGPSGEAVQTEPYVRDLRFDYQGRVVTALRTFDADVAGIYNIDISGDVPSTARVSVGHVADFGLVAGLAGAIILFVGSLLALLATVVIVVIKRGRTVLPNETTGQPLSRV